MTESHASSDAVLEPAEIDCVEHPLARDRPANYLSGAALQDQVVLRQLLPWMGPLDIYTRRHSIECRETLSYIEFYRGLLPIARKTPSAVDVSPPPPGATQADQALHVVRQDIAAFVREGASLVDVLASVEGSGMGLLATATTYRLFRDVYADPSPAPRSIWTPFADDPPVGLLRLVETLAADHPDLPRFLHTGFRGERRLEHAALLSTLTLVASLHAERHVLRRALNAAHDSAFWGESEFLCPLQAFLVRIVAATRLDNMGLALSFIRLVPPAATEPRRRPTDLAIEAAYALLYRLYGPVVLRHVNQFRGAYRSARKTYLRENFPVTGLVATSSAFHLAGVGINNISPLLARISRGAFASVVLPALLDGDRGFLSYLDCTTKPCPGLSGRERLSAVLTADHDFTVFDLGAGVRYAVDLP